MKPINSPRAVLSYKLCISPFENIISIVPNNAVFVSFVTAFIEIYDSKNNAANIITVNILYDTATFDMNKFITAGMYKNKLG